MKPKHIILDKDSIFFCGAFKKWCKRKKIKPRFGAVNKHGSIAVIERFIKSLKNEGTRKIAVSFRLDIMREELTHYVNWYNEYRPHNFLDGKTPNEVLENLVPSYSKPRFEPRYRWPRGSPCAAPQVKIKGVPGSEFVLVIGFLEGRRHLPIIVLKHVA